MDPTSPEGSTPGKVIIIAPEDNTAYTIVPQLRASGADLNNVFILSDVKRTSVSGDANTLRSRFSIPQDLPVLKRNINQLGDVRLVIIDPLMACATRTIAFNLQARLHMIEPIQSIAAETGTAFWMTHHFNKATNLTNLEDKINGSGGVLDALRVTDVLIRDPVDPEIRLFLTLLNNIERDGDAVEFKIAGSDKDTHVEYRVPAPSVTAENIERVQAFMVGMIRDAARLISSQELASYFRLDHQLVKRILVVTEHQGLIKKVRGAYTVPAIEAQPADTDKNEPISAADIVAHTREI